MEQQKRNAIRWMIVALALCLLGMIGASLVQSSGGKVAVRDLRWETTHGRTMSGLLFIPEGVSAKNPVPGIVVSHGMYNNREMQDLNFVELSRRGFVVLSMDMYSHGNSESWTSSSKEILTGMYEAVKMMDSLSIVDSSKIGITGHSLGGMSSNRAVVLDNAADRQLVSAVLLNCADPTYVDAEGKYANIYGNRDVGVIAAQYDEWFFRQDDGKGNRTAPRDYIRNSNAQSFLHFGSDPSGLDARNAGMFHTRMIEGKQAVRIVYDPAIIHPWSHFSRRSTVATIEFFERTLGTPHPIPAIRQVWQWKVLFNLLGVIGFGMFVVNFTSFMLFTPAFASLRAREIMRPVPVKDAKGKLWFWGTLSACAVFGTLVYLPILKAVKGHASVRGLWRQSGPWGIGLWAATCGLAAIVCMVLSYRVYGKRSGMSLVARGVSVSPRKLGRTALLALIAVAASYALVFIADYFFNVDFRIWVLALKAFGPEKILVALFPYLPLFLVYYVANSVAVNAFDYNTVGKSERGNLAILAAFNAVPVVVLLLMQYIHFFITGQLLFASNMYIVWLFPMLVILPVAAVISRKIYRLTANPYLGGFINAMLVTMISCSNTLTFL